MKTKKGFTLIELVLYVVIVSMMLGALLPFMFEIMSGSVQSSTEQDVVSTARLISERIKVEIRKAKSIQSLTAGSLTLQNISGPDTTIDLKNGNVRLDRGTGAVSLNPPSTVVTDLTFANYSSADLKTKHVKFNLTVRSLLTTGRQEYQRQVALESSEEIRNN